MKYICQRDYPHIPYITRINPDHPEHEKGKTTTVFTSGCGLCCGIMVLDRLLPSYKFELEDAIQLSYDSGANKGRGTGKAFFAALADKFGLTLQISEKKEDLLHCLKTGGAAIVLVAGDKEAHTGLFTYGGHYMVVISQEEDGRLAILDPYFFPEKFDEEHRKGRVEIKNDVIILCDVDTLHAETEKKRPDAYFLFHRK